MMRTHKRFFFIAVLIWTVVMTLAKSSSAFQQNHAPVYPDQSVLNSGIQYSSTSRLDAARSGQNEEGSMQQQLNSAGVDRRRVELGVFASRSSSSGDKKKSFDPRKPNRKAEDPSQEDDSSKKRGIGGGVRAIFRRFRGGGKKDDDDNDDVKKRKPKAKSNVKKSPSKTKKSSNQVSPYGLAGSALLKKSPASKAKPTEEKGDDETTPSWTSFWRGNRTSAEDDDATEGKNKQKSSFPSVVQKLTQRLVDSSGDGNREQWVTVFPKTRISPGEMVPVTVDGIDLLVIASNDGKKRLYCIENSCPHLGTPLELGQLVRLPRVDEEGTTDDESDARSIEQQQTAKEDGSSWTELQVSSILQQDGCEDCIVCPLHKTAFALESGQPRGEWCPYPPVVGKVVGTLKKPTAAPIFGVRVRGKDVQVRMNTPIEPDQTT